jgi:uncharacterized delta-60 repeat protein
MKNQNLFFGVKRVAFSFMVSFSTTLFAQFGVLDNSFGTNGRTITSAFDVSGTPRVNTMAIQSDGKIILVGQLYRSSGYDFALARYTVNGLLDNTFGTNGKVTMDFSGQLAKDVISCVTVQPDGKIVVAGTVTVGTSRLIALARFNTNGSLDNTFDSDGKVTTSLSTNIADVGAIALQPDGKIVIGATTRTAIDALADSKDFALVRYLPNGSLDNTFGTLGKVETDFSNTQDQLIGLALQPDGKIVAVGWSYDGSSKFALARYQPNGALDNSFGNSGFVTTRFPGYSTANDVAIQPDGKIVVAGGYQYENPQTLVSFFACALARYNVNGSLDNTFNLTGQIADKRGYSAESLVIQPNGKIVLAGKNYLLRYETDGSADNSFGNSGVVSTLDILYYPTSIELQQNGKIVIAGINDNFANFAVARYTSGIRVGIVDFSIANRSVFVAPNPISEQTTLHYTLQEDETISIQLFDMKGALVKVFKENEKQTKGEHEERLSFQNEIPTGSYILCISSPKGKRNVQIVKMK